jgi:hypothetical protein
VNLATLEQAALQREPAEIGPTALDEMLAAHNEFQHYLDTHRDTFIYGVTRWSTDHAGAPAQMGSST